MIIIFKILNYATVEIYFGSFEQYIKYFSKKIKLLVSVKTLSLVISLGSFWRVFIIEVGIIHT